MLSFKPAAGLPPTPARAPRHPVGQAEDLQRRELAAPPGGPHSIPDYRNCLWEELHVPVGPAEVRCCPHLPGHWRQLREGDQG